MATVASHDGEKEKNGKINVTQSSDRHQIFQTDDSITIVCNETHSTSSHSDTLEDISPSAEKKKKSNDDNDHQAHANENIATSTSNSEATISKDSNERDDETFPKSILTNCNNDLAKSYVAKKSVSFENDESIEKFIKGEEILDKRNPFRNTSEEAPYFIAANKSKKIDETDFISKEEILKQSKYVPVYIRNPDRVLTYDRSVLEKLSPEAVKIVRRAPIPVPRKSIKKPKERKSKPSRVDSRYPDLADIKVKICDE